ncbi:GLPGLI family protein [Flavobacterium sp. 2]|uniref:GLPGLI family protein n=1 Tax=Flavobacterium sp. 2 TaxID=308053 RepID=UPI000C1A7908|nr:GLPGLI family protein [Flavobacterium sp. 2]PIF59041.1 GLPGLI family protein [Flavobacterium sp. 2]
MKKIFILILFIYFQGYSQSIKATYVSTVIKSIGKVSENLSNTIKPKTFTYSYSNKKSVYEFIPVQKSSIDTSYIEHDGRKFETYNQVILPTIDITFKDLKNNALRKEYNVNNKYFSAKDKLTDYEWTIIDETTTVLGYKCKKATTKKSLALITAWYCEEIPINDGPGEFWGLPGLILKVELGGYSTITLDRIKISKENNEIKEPINKSQQLSLSEYYKSIRAHLEATNVFNKYK